MFNTSSFNIKYLLRYEKISNNKPGKEFMIINRTEYSIKSTKPGKYALVQASIININHISLYY